MRRLQSSARKRLKKLGIEPTESEQKSLKRNELCQKSIPQTPITESLNFNPLDAVASAEAAVERAVRGEPAPKRLGTPRHHWSLWLRERGDLFLRLVKSAAVIWVLVCAGMLLYSFATEQWGDLLTWLLIAIFLGVLPLARLLDLGDSGRSTTAGDDTPESPPDANADKTKEKKQEPRKCPFAGTIYLHKKCVKENILGGVETYYSSGDTVGKLEVKDDWKVYDGWQVFGWIDEDGKIHKESIYEHTDTTPGARHKSWSNIAFEVSGNLVFRNGEGGVCGNLSRNWF